MHKSGDQILLRYFSCSAIFLGSSFETIAVCHLNSILILQEQEKRNITEDHLEI